MDAIPDTLEVANPACLIPADAVAITNKRHTELLTGESLGQLIVADESGYPVLADPPPPGSEVLAAIERHWRDERLLVTDGVVSRHRDELEEGSATTLSVEQYAELQAFRRALRDWPQVGEFPLIDHRPIEPQWLVDSLQ
ncbi:phage tail assembly chaperone [Pseudomonas putida]|nr:phage tail assembly chaperone [Pseudomonas putida]MDD2047330.1 phage tail assembly chaperone [Pseudomonas putida]